ncbi:hypothetical protein PoB_000444800 [Plakobranchus ocellatus]|uniref:Uncharacterized protein n=1 Tax=Plakobranchus ocellatus TaxID=259542 RepID=A0AAV3Y5W3_9GAST|nr:hypothetical protein PoB_000444800 [Plakobranchus ocellatus]
MPDKTPTFYTSEKSAGVGEQDLAFPLAFFSINDQLDVDYDFTYLGLTISDTLLLDAEIGRHISKAEMTGRWEVACTFHNKVISGFWALPHASQGAGGGARTRNRRVPADLRADSLATVPPTPPSRNSPQNMVRRSCAFRVEI